MNELIQLRRLYIRPWHAVFIEGHADRHGPAADFAVLNSAVIAGGGIGGGKEEGAAMRALDVQFFEHMDIFIMPYFGSVARQKSLPNQRVPRHTACILCE